MSVAEVLVFTRLAADKVGATKMDRPEDIKPNPATGKVYLALTNNTNRGRPGFPGVDEANPRTPNREGHVLEPTEAGNHAAARTFAWNLLLVCGLPESAGTYFGGYDGPRLADLLPRQRRFRRRRRPVDLHRRTARHHRVDDALHRVTLTGAERGRVEQFLAVPRDAETCGPVIDSQDGWSTSPCSTPARTGHGPPPARSSRTTSPRAPSKTAVGEAQGPASSKSSAMKADRRRGARLSLTEGVPRPLRRAGVLYADAEHGEPRSCLRPVSVTGSPADGATPTWAGGATPVP